MQRKLAILVSIIIVVGIFGFTSLTFLAHVESRFHEVLTPDPSLIEQGEYLARVSDCAACHTSIGGAYYAGGLGISSPVGVMYSTNITPDKKTGIGSFTLADFDKAVRFGVRPGGDTLYPAMPYPSFSRMTDEDVRALYAFFMLKVPAVENANKRADIVWPLSIRWPVTIWRMAFSPRVVPYRAPAGVEPLLARGEYIVTGPGHCGACHTPRGIGLQEQGYEGKDSEFLSGGSVIDNWTPISLRNDPTYGLGAANADEIAMLLKTGRSDHSAVLGGMADVVAWSTQYMTEDDLRAVALYLKSLPDVPLQQAQFKAETKTNRMLAGDINNLSNGAKIYAEQCSICHLNSGEGIARIFPALRNNPVVNAKNPTSSINVVLNGAVLPPSRWTPSAVAMPNFSNLTNEDVANVVNFIRTGWGNVASTVVTAADVGKIRSSSANLGVTRGGWTNITPQPMGGNWTFGIETHNGKDYPQ
ncbi:c-type cytochrome [Bartonella sp. LJL80]